MLQYVTDSLIASAKRRGRIPDGAFSAAELLAIANEEMESYLVPLIVGVQEDYYEADSDYTVQVDALQTTTPSVLYRLPTRAAGNALREVQFLDTAGSVVDVPQISVDDMEQADWGFLLKGSGVLYMNKQNRSDIVTMRVTFSMLPNQLVQSSGAAVVAGISGYQVSLGALTTPPWPLDPPDAGAAPASFAGQTTFDCVKGTPGFEILGYDLTGSCTGSILTLSALPPSGLEVGDYVCLARQTPVPQAPTVLWGLLAQSIACSLLSQMGEGEREQAELAKRKLLEQQTLPLIKNRVRGAPKSIIPRHGIFQAVRRW